MAFLASDLDAINAAIASGELTVSFSDRTVTYRSIKELIAARELIMADLRENGILPKKKNKITLISRKMF